MKSSAEEHLTIRRRSRHLVGFDGMRAVACFMVIGHHLSQKLAPQLLSETAKELRSLALLGEIGVSVFFVLSGALLALPFWRSWLTYSTLPSLKSYALKRFSRIAPAFYLALSVSFLLSIFVFNATVDAQLVSRYLAGLGFVSAFHWSTFFPTESNGPLWTIGFEVIAYFLLIPFMLFMYTFLKKRKIHFGMIYWLVIILLCVSVNLLVTHFIAVPDDGKGWQYGLIGGAKEWMPYYNPLGMFCHFLIGVLAAGTISYLQLVEKMPEIKFDLAVIAVWLGTGWFLFKSRAPETVVTGLFDTIYFWPWFPLAIAISLVCLPFTRWLGTWFDNPFFHYVAKISFGLYLWHFLIMDLLANQFFPHFIIMGCVDWSSWVGPSILSLLIAWLVAECSYRYVERPALDWAGNRLQGNQKRQVSECSTIFPLCLPQWLKQLRGRKAGGPA